MPCTISLQKLEDILSSYRSLGWYERWISTTPDSDLAVSFIQLVTDVKTRQSNSPVPGKLADSPVYLNDDELFKFITLTIKANQSLVASGGKLNSRANRLYDDMIQLVGTELVAVFQTLNQYQLIDIHIVKHICNMKPPEGNVSYRYEQRVLSKVNDSIELFEHFKRLSTASVYWIIKACEEHITQQDRLGPESTLQQAEAEENRFNELNKRMLNAPSIPDVWSVFFGRCKNIDCATSAFFELGTHLPQCTPDIVDALSRAKNPLSFARSIKRLIINKLRGIDPAWLVPAVNPEDACNALFTIVEMGASASCVTEDLKSKILCMKEPMAFMKDVLFLFQRNKGLFNKKMIELLYNSHTMLSPNNGLLSFFADKPSTHLDQSLLHDLSIVFLAKYEFSENSFKLLTLLGGIFLSKEKVQMVCDHKLNITTMLQVIELIKGRLTLDSDLVNLLLTTPISTKAVNQIKQLMASDTLDKENLLHVMRETKRSQTIKTTQRVQFLGQPNETDPPKARGKTFTTPSSH